MDLGHPPTPELSQGFHFSESQKKILQTHYQNGITSTSLKDKISEIAVEIGATNEQVKHWINAERGRCRRRELKEQSQTLDSVADCRFLSIEEAELNITVKKARKRSGFQLFCSAEADKISGDKSAVMSELSKRWSNLSNEGKEEWKVKASETNTWTDVSKKKLVRDLTLSINENLKSLSALGYEGYTLVLNKSTGDHKVMCSSETVQDFLDCEEERKRPIEETFFKYMCGASYFPNHKKRKLTYDGMLEEVRADWKRKYKAACGDGRIPYSNLESLKCVAVGLPPGVTFRQPALYKSSELTMIHGSLEKISFCCLADCEEMPENVVSVSTSEEPPNQS